MDDCPSRWREVEAVVRFERVESSPSPNKVPYRIYQGVSDVFKCLWKLMVIEMSMEAHGMEKRNNSEYVVSGRWYFHSKGEERCDS